MLIPLTLGASEAVSKVVDVARLTAAGARIAEICRAFRVAAEASGVPAVSAAAAAVRAIGELGPLLGARAQLLVAESTTSLLGKDGLDLFRRPYVRVDIRKQVEDAAPKTPDGKYYIVSRRNSPDVLVPVSKQYGEDILGLPKDAEGRYYLGANGVRYPVNPVYHLGHIPGEEWWRIREMAITNHWSRQQLIEYCNQTRIWRIEDAPGNLSHAHELPRE